MSRRLALATAGLMTGLMMSVVGPAAAQSAPRVDAVMMPTQLPRQEGQVRIQSNISLFLAGPTGDSDEARQLRDRAHRMIYDMAGRECDLLRETLARECRLESVNNNINTNRGYNAQQPDGYTVNGTMTMVIMLK